MRCRPRELGLHNFRHHNCRHQRSSKPLDVLLLDLIYRYQQILQTCNEMKVHYNSRSRIRRLCTRACPRRTPDALLIFAAGLVTVAEGGTRSEGRSSRKGFEQSQAANAREGVPEPPHNISCRYGGRRRSPPARPMRLVGAMEGPSLALRCSVVPAPSHEGSLHAPLSSAEKTMALPGLCGSAAVLLTRVPSPTRIIHPVACPVA